MCTLSLLRDRTIPSSRPEQNTAVATIRASSSVFCASAGMARFFALPRFASPRLASSGSRRGAKNRNTEAKRTESWQRNAQQKKRGAKKRALPLLFATLPRFA